MLRCFFARRQNVLVVYSLPSRRIVVVAADLPCVRFRHCKIVRSADALQEPTELGGILQSGWRHDDRINHHHAGSQVGVASTQLERNGAAQAMADHNRLLKTELSTLP